MIGDDPVVERAPIVDLWIKEARRHGAEVVVCSPTGTEKIAPGAGAETLPRARDRPKRSREEAARGGAGGARLVRPGRRRRRTDRGARARARVRATKPGCGAFHLPAAANPRGVALGWAVAADADETNPEPIELLIVSGDEAAAQRRRARARRAGEARDRAHDVPRARRRLGRPDPAVDRPRSSATAPR